MFKTMTATIALLALANPALAAACATPNEAAALRTAVIQQELMVAALQCHETAAYNRFVIGYRGELQTSDAILKSFFIRRGGEHGEAGYDTFKTKAANLSALEQARNGQAFCADAHALFAAAFANKKWRDEIRGLQPYLLAQFTNRVSAARAATPETWLPTLKSVHDPETNVKSCLCKSRNSRLHKRISGSNLRKPHEI